MRPLVVSLSLLAVSSAACTGPEAEPGVRSLPIVGGTTSPDSFLPGVGALVLSNPWFGTQAFCTATLISDQLVLSAAHCFEQIPAGSAVSFAVGSVASKGKLAPLASWQIHPSYKGGNPPGTLADWYDISVGRLKAPTTLAQPLKLVRPKEVGPLIKYGAPLLIVGYGKTNPQSDLSSGVKHHGTTELAQVGSSEIFVSNQGSGPTKCSGDSGGPTLADADSGAGADYRIIGVASRADQGCAYGSVETRVDPYLSWIHGFGTIPCGSGLSADCGTVPPPPPPVKKELGQTCTAAGDCKGDLCIPVGAGQPMVCSQLCALAAATACPTGYHCVPIVGKTEGACVLDTAQPPPAKKGLGEACATSAECQSAICASSGEQSYCTELCTPEKGCALESMECAPAGGSTFACAPKATEEPGDGGGGCAVHPRTAEGGAARPLAGVLLLLLAALALVLRRR
jgi:hypothetical protein